MHTSGYIWVDEVLVHSNRGRRVVPRTDVELPTTVPASPGALVAGGLLPEHEFPTSDTQHDRRLVFRRRTVGEPESTVPAGISDEVAPTLPATSDQLRAIRVVAMEKGDTDTLVSADSRRGHDMEAAEVRDPELRDVDDESRAAGDSSVDAESMDGREESVMGPEDPVPHVEEDLELPLPGGAAVRDALIALDEVDPCRMFEQRASVMKGVPKFLRGPFRNALKFALQEATAQDVMRQTRGWKLFMMLPRMLLHRSPGGGHISKSKLEARFTLFNQGGWQELI